MTLVPITRRYVERTDGITASHRSGSEWYAGGTDVIPLTRTGVLEVDTIIDLKSGEAASPLSATIERNADTWVIGALTTLADLADHDEIADTYPAIRDAITQAATLQIRHRATVGGNLLQRPRCSYYRDPEVECWMKGGTDCPAKNGRNEHHALVDEACIATQPSDLASVLVAIGAEVTISNGDASRTVAVEEFLQRPTAARRQLHSLADGELVESVSVPVAGTSRSTYFKAMDRAVWQFALVGVAAVVDVDEVGDVVSASLVASGVDSVPHRLSAAADALIGSPLSSDSIETAALLADSGLVPQSENAYKRRLLRGLVQRALESLVA